MIWFTADLHLGHKNIIEYCNRPFSSVEEMDEEIIKRWNLVVGEKDEVYVLGDFTLRPYSMAKEYISRLSGKIHIIPGNHDSWIPKVIGTVPSSKIEIHHPIHELKYNGKTLVLSHYAMRVWNKSHLGSYHLHGHSHGLLSLYEGSMDVGVDLNYYYPICADHVIFLLDRRKHNER